MTDQYQELLNSTLHLLVDPIAQDNIIETSKEGEQWRINIKTSHRSLVIGYKGETIKAIQHIARVIMHRKFVDDRTHFLIDVESFRKMREQTIMNHINDLAVHDVLSAGKTLILVNITSYERRLVHQMLSEVDGIETSSIGEPDNRKLMIRPVFSSSDSGSTENSIIVDINRLINIPEMNEETD